MPDPAIYDAINIFKYSPVGRGARTVGGDPEYQARYANLIERSIDVLWALWSDDELGYADVGDSTFGQHKEGRWGTDIRISDRYRPDVGAAYTNAVNQAKVAATSLILSHESIHRAHDRPYVEEEVACRTVQNLYYHDLVQGIRYTSRVSGTPCVAKLESNSPALEGLLWTYDIRIRKHGWRQTVDLVVNNPTYGQHLDVDFVTRSANWWGGLENRWPTTRGHYLRVLAGAGLGPHRGLMLRIFESFSGAAEWRRASTTAGSVEEIRWVMRHGLYDNDFLRRAREVEHRLLVDLGATPD
ncbi:MAG: hypothetical protein R3344_10100 [Acidobacteriota bacterium]|nr:hypothetical protein [Acidobacteriota bacterium]